MSTPYYQSHTYICWKSQYLYLFLLNYIRKPMDKFRQSPLINLHSVKETCSAVLIVICCIKQCRNDLKVNNVSVLDKVHSGNKQVYKNNAHNLLMWLWLCQNEHNYKNSNISNNRWSLIINFSFSPYLNIKNKQNIDKHS